MIARFASPQSKGSAPYYSPARMCFAKNVLWTSGLCSSPKAISSGSVALMNNASKINDWQMNKNWPVFYLFGLSSDGSCCVRSARPNSTRRCSSARCQSARRWSPVLIQKFQPDRKRGRRDCGRAINVNLVSAVSVERAGVYQPLILLLKYLTRS